MIKFNELNIRLNYHKRANNPSFALLLIYHATLFFKLDQSYDQPRIQNHSS